MKIQNTTQSNQFQNIMPISETEAKSISLKHIFMTPHFPELVPLKGKAKPQIVRIYLQSKSNMENKC
jgi:hypothetical protein